MKVPSILASLVLLPLLSLAARAQGAVWIVDDDGGAGVDFTVLQDAIDAAANGDVLLIKAGTYDPRPAFPPTPTTIDGKTLTLVAEKNTQPLVRGLAVRNVATAQSVALRGFRFDVAVLLEDCAGVLWIEDCTFQTPSLVGNTQPLQVEDCDAVHLNRCVARAGMQINTFPSGLLAVDSEVHLYDCTIRGADGYVIIQDGGDGVELSGGFLFASNSTFTGGDSGCGGDGLHLRGTSPVAYTLGCTFAAGTPFSCTGTIGVEVRVDAGTHTVLPGTPRTFAATGPARVGESTVLTVTGAPGDIVIVGAAADAGSVYLPGLRGAFELSLASTVPYVLGAIPAGGTLQVSVPLPPLAGPGQTLFLQAAAFTPGTGTTLAGGSLLQLLAN